MRKLSGAALIGLLTVLLLVGSVSVLGANSDQKTASIGVLLPLSGDFASYGSRGKAIIEKAEKDINEFAEEAELPYKFNFIYEDTETKPNVALDKVKSLASKGVEVVTGLISSGDIRLIKGYADANNIVVISPFSTVAELGVADDYVFRPIPHDDMAGKAIARLVENRGIEHAALLVRQDPCDVSIANKAEEMFEELGIEVLTRVEFSGGTQEFSGELSSLERAVNPAIEEHGEDKVAVVSLTWEDLARVLSQADSRNSNLLDVMWTGGDAVAHSSVIIEDVGSIAADIQLISPMYTTPSSSKKAEVEKYLEEELGESPDIYSLITYDASWLAASSILTAGDYDGTAIKKALPTVANNYYGVSGWTKLNELGDREALDINLWAVRTVDGEPKWVKVGYYSAATGEVSWSG